MVYVLVREKRSQIVGKSAKLVRIAILDANKSHCKIKHGKFPIILRRQNIKPEQEIQSLTHCQNSSFLFVDFIAGDQLEDVMVEIVRKTLGFFARNLPQLGRNILLQRLGRLQSSFLTPAFQPENKLRRHVALTDSSTPNGLQGKMGPPHAFNRVFTFYSRKKE